jgi:TonB-dependent starch-binding outer membrane protein SusC
VIKGTNTATSTNSKKEFTIRVADENAILAINYVGYEMQEIKVKSQLISILH